MDWRLLHRRCPGIQPAGLIDTLRLARHVHPGDKRNSLTALLDRCDLSDDVSRSAVGSQPHRALWDTMGAALLLAKLISDMPGGTLTIDQLQRIAGLPINNDQLESRQLPLLDL